MLLLTEAELKDMRGQAQVELEAGQVKRIIYEVVERGQSVHPHLTAA